MRGRIRTVIPDENHAVVGIKRKTLLIMAVDRLVPLCGECQRIALSATVNPEGDVAGVIGGFMIAGDKAGPRYIPLKVARCREHQQHRDGIHVRIPDAEKRPSLKVLRLGFDTIVAPRSLVRYRRTGT
jgi:ATP-dependent Lhr-like helicase